MEKQIRQGKNRKKIAGRTAISEALQICVGDANFKDYSFGLGKLRNQKDCKPFRLQSFFCLTTPPLIQNWGRLHFDVAGCICKE